MAKNSSRIQHAFARPTVLRRRSRQACTLFISLCAAHLVYTQFSVPRSIISEQVVLLGRTSPGNTNRDTASTQLPAPLDRQQGFQTDLDYTLPFPVYYVNMDTSTARRSRMELDFGAYWDLHRIPAVDGRNMSRLLDLMGQGNYNWISPHISEDRSPDTINRAELGCVLSHLVAIRNAYVDGHTAAMIVEDDITPLFMPFWTSSIRDLVSAADSIMPPDQDAWGLIQLSWIWGLNDELYDGVAHRADGPMHQLVQTRFQFGTSAYVISRSGMRKVLNAYFSDDTPTSQVRLEQGGRQAELYVSTASNILVTVPSLFPIEGSDTTISTGEEEERRLRSHRESNSIHAQATMDLFRAATVSNRAKIVGVNEARYTNRQ